MEIRKLNTIRAIAALIVFVGHYSHQAKLLVNIFGNGSPQIGVMLFFILSGFLMSYLYMNREFELREVRNFAVARFARVYPLFLLIVVFAYYSHLIGAGTVYRVDSFSGFVENLTLLNCPSVLWTVPIEIHFYFFFVLIWWFASKRWLYAMFLMIAVFYVVTITGYPTFKGSLLIDYHVVFPQFFPFFFAGVIFGQLYRNWTPRMKSGVFVSALLIVPVLFPGVFGPVFKTYHNMWEGVLCLLCLSFVFFVILFFVPDNNPILANRFGDYLGKISYSMYLLHLPVVNMLKNPARDMPVLFFFICLALTIGISAASYHFIEKPSRNAIRGRFLVQRPEKGKQPCSRKQPSSALSAPTPSG
ncbi:MAG: acyltransferase [Deltaproteobacteria bacterium]|nr:acyltransferase [Candidatus Zymogenaceae bacterium]